jgi:uncharacterized membrane protein
MTEAVEPSASKVSSGLTRAIWFVLVLLVILGVVAGIGRALYVGDLGARVDPSRIRAFEALHLNEPFVAERPAEIARLEGRYAAHPWLILLHVLPGALFLLLAPFQFSKRIRNRHIRVHRWSGRLLLVLAIVWLVPGLYFGIRVPWAGPSEATVVGLVGAYVIIAIIQGYLAIRRGQRARHREWMIRLFAAAIGISTVRVVSIGVDLALTSAGYRLTELFIVSISLGWILTLGAAELWIRHTRPHPVSERVTA